MAEAERQPQQRRQSESGAAAVPDEVLIDILVRLSDYRSVIKCRLVCKRWLSLISHSKYFRCCFFNRLLAPNNNNDNDSDGDNSQSFLPYTLLFRRDYDKNSFILAVYHSAFIRSIGRPDLYPSYDLFSEKSKILHGQERLNCSNNSNSNSGYLDFLGWPNPIIRSSFKDLLLIQQNRNQLYICNPLTKQRVALPTAPLPFPDFMCGFVCEKHTCDDNCSRIKYRVVLISWDDKDMVFRMVIFSSETGEWNELSLSVPPSLLLGMGPKWHSAAVACNGVLYWELFSGYELKTIVAFDPFKQQCRFISPPIACGAGTHLGVVHGRLRLSRNYFFNLDVWELNLICDSNDYGGGDWILVHHIDGVRSHLSMTLIGVHPDGDVFFFLSQAGFGMEIGIYEYRIGKDSYEEVCNYQADKWPGVFTLVHPWLPTKIPTHPCSLRGERY